MSPERDRARDFPSHDWRARHFQSAQEQAGPRYTARLNVELPIAEVLDALRRTERFYHGVRKRKGQLKRTVRFLPSEYPNKRISNNHSTFIKRVHRVCRELDRIHEYSASPIKWSEIQKLALAARRSAWRFVYSIHREQRRIWSLERKDDSRDKWSSSAADQFNASLHYARGAIDELSFFVTYARSVSAKLSNSPFLLLQGEAGIGKTHLLCDVMRADLEEPAQTSPALLVFGESFQRTSDPWREILGQLGLSLTANQFLDRLNRAGRSSGSRSVLMIDALNETRRSHRWKRHLAKITEKISRYKHVALVISVRAGFEDEVLSNRQRRVFTAERHPGFRFREWEAVKTFFDEHDLPLPEVPLLRPEFQNPLFLLLFCKAVKKRLGSPTTKRPREAFRGHEGSTYIFESFIASASATVAKQFGIPHGSKASVWNRVIKPVASRMIDGATDRVSEADLKGVIESAYPTIDHSAFLTALDRNLLLVRIAVGQEKGSSPAIYYRFPFQRFSDHLVGRYIFKKYEAALGGDTKTLLNARRFFSRRTKIGKMLAQSWDSGLIEALSVQCPEHLKGVDFVEVAPYLRDTQVGLEAFISSLIWRKASAFTHDLKNTFAYINDVVLRYNDGFPMLMNSVLTVASVPDHPLNGDFLHHYLIKMKMPERDSHWSAFIHYEYGAKEAVDRIVTWAWSQHDKDHISDKPIRLLATVLCWFLTSSNRSLRDCSTKAVASLLAGRLSTALPLLRQFEDVDDPYVLERVYAAVFGACMLRQDDVANLTKIARYVYGRNFVRNKLPVHVLTRDYARGIVELALNNKAPVRVSMKRLSPPYSSKFPVRVPTLATLKRKYYPYEFFEGESEDRGLIDIWSSVMESDRQVADFSRQVLDTSVRHWTGIRLGQQWMPRIEAVKQFKEMLKPDELELCFAMNRTMHGLRFGPLIWPEQPVRGMSSLLGLFERALNARAARFFRKEIRPYVDEHGSVQDPLEDFDVSRAERWLFNRVVQLGWSAKLHGDFDFQVRRSSGHAEFVVSEPIGKKYQWIAFHELLARLADNFKFKTQSVGYKIVQYEGPWQVGARDIDPSMVLPSIPVTNQRRLPQFNAALSRMEYQDKGRIESNSDWLRDAKDLPPIENAILLHDESEGEWLSCGGGLNWEEKHAPEEERFSSLTRQVWFIVNCYFVRAKFIDEVFEWAQTQNFMGRWMPEPFQMRGVFIGEWPWAPSMSEYSSPWSSIENSRWRVMNGREEYLGISSDDASFDGTPHIQLPSHRLVRALGLKHPNADGQFCDGRGRPVAFDLRIEGGPKCVVVNRDRFEAFLKRNDLAPIWVVIGEKCLLGGVGQPLGWLEASGAFRIAADGELVGSMGTRFREPGVAP